MALKVNDTLHGFKVTRVRDLRDCEGTLIEMEHEKTGCLLAWLDREDENKSFCIGFKTVPTDSTGVFHILEHSVLNGSRKYPVREPFVDLLKSSMQTFLNAMTYPDRTLYPVSSRNDQDFLNLMDVYLDAVFFPCLYNNRHVFEQEGWHYELHSVDEEPVYKGVVFNEMKGAFGSVDEVIQESLNQLLFPDNCYKYCSGGDPVHIPELTYEQYVDTHKKFYHPSNAKVFLDGSLDIDAALKKLDEEYLSLFEKQDMHFDIPEETKCSTDTKTVRYEVSAEEVVNRTVLAWGRVLCGYEDIERLVAWNVLAGVLSGNNDSPFKKAVLESGLADDLDILIVDEVMQPYLAFVIRNTEPEHAEELMKRMVDAGRRVCANGMDHEEILATLNQMEFRYLEKQEPAGVINATEAFRSWNYDGDPAMYLDRSGVFDTLRSKVEDGYFENLLEDDFLNGAYCCVKAVPSKTLAEDRMAFEQERLAEAKKSWGDCSKQVQDTLRLEEWQDTPDSSEAKATLPQLSLSDVNPLPVRFDAEVMRKNGLDLRVYDTHTDLVYGRLYFELGGLKLEDLSEVSLFADLLTRMPTSKYTVLELEKRIRGVFGALNCSVTSIAPDHRVDATKPLLSVSFSCLKKNLEEAMDLILEVLLETKVEKDRTLTILKQELEDFRQSLSNSGTVFAVARSLAHVSADGVVAEHVNGFSAAKALEEMLAQPEESMAKFVEKAEMFRNVLFTKERLVVSINGKENVELVASKLGVLPSQAYERCVVHYPLLEGDKEAIQIPSQVSYSAFTYNLDDKYYTGALRVLTHITRFDYLWDQVRVHGGAYGVNMSSRMGGTVTLSSYRDPTPNRSLKVYQDLPAYVHGFDQEVTPYIIGTIASAEPLLTLGGKMSAEDARWFANISYEERKNMRRAILDTDRAQMAELAPVLEEAQKQGVSVIVGPADAIEEGTPVLSLK